MTLLYLIRDHIIGVLLQVNIVLQLRNLCVYENIKQKYAPVIESSWF